VKVSIICVFKTAKKRDLYADVQFNTLWPRTKESSKFVLVRVSIFPPKSMISGVVEVVVFLDGDLQR
jgi:hypothetical protein